MSLHVSRVLSTICVLEYIDISEQENFILIPFWMIRMIYLDLKLCVALLATSSFGWLNSRCGRVHRWFCVPLHKTSFYLIPVSMIFAAIFSTEHFLLSMLGGDLMLSCWVIWLEDFPGHVEILVL